MKKLRIIFLAILLCISFVGLRAFAATPTNAGFVPANIWYSKDPFVEDDSIKIYTLIFNPDSRELSGSVLFFDNDVLLGKKSFTAPGNNVAQVNISWVATVGQHLIYAKIENTKFLISAGKYTDVYLDNNESDKSSRTVSKKVLPTPAAVTTTPVTTETASDTTATGDPFASITNTIADKTPSSVSKVVLGTATGLEAIRANADAQLSSKKDEVQGQLNTLNNASLTTSKEKQKDATVGDKIQKPLKYVELFFLKLFSFIVGYRIVFYSLLALFVFFLLRGIWRKFF